MFIPDDEYEFAAHACAVNLLAKGRDLIDAVLTTFAVTAAARLMERGDRGGVVFALKIRKQLLLALAQRAAERSLADEIADAEAPSDPRRKNNTRRARRRQA